MNEYVFAAEPVKQIKGIQAAHASCSEVNTPLFWTVGKLRVGSQQKAEFAGD